MITLTLDPATERRLADIARGRGMSQEAVARTLIEVSLEDIDDIDMATDRLSSPLPPASAAEARAALGLND